jgi:xylulokinase
MDGFLLGFDIGSSSIKASLISVTTGQSVATAQSPSDEMSMIALRPGWAEQDPLVWWEHAVICARSCLYKSGINADSVLAIGLAYQMHGLVAVDINLNPIRKAIIWCDSRAVSIGEKAFSDLGKHYCLQHFLNSPGNFTASKLKWVKSNEPELFAKIYKVMLPGDFLVLKMSGEITTTATGLSEGIFWDFERKTVSKKLLNYFEIDPGILPTIVPVFSKQAGLSKGAAAELGLRSGTPISYRAGDQPNNAFSLGVVNPGETAATAGTSGVVYSVTDKNAFDTESRVNSFIHVNNAPDSVRNGILLCVNGTGIQNSWLRKNLGGPDYAAMNALASRAAIGSKGIVVLPFGNGAERILGNQDIGGSVHGVNFNSHDQSDLFRAAQEGIVFALRYGFDILAEMGVKTSVIKAGNANMFLSPVFRDAFVNTLGTNLELYSTDGATGAAMGAGVGAGIYDSFQEAFRGLHLINSEAVDSNKEELYANAYHHWKKVLHQVLPKN